jgi:hypothetical protein
MAKLSFDDPGVAATGADPGKRKVRDHEARGHQSSPLTSDWAGRPISVGGQRRTLLRDPKCVASSPVGVALDLITAKQNGAA